MKRILTLAALAFATLTKMHATSVPTLEDLNRALDRARQTWQYALADPVTFRLARLNACDLRQNPDVAMIQIADSQTIVRFDDSEPSSTQHSYAYIIVVNSACDWDRIDLESIILHEYGHILTGPNHSADSGSVMYWTRTGRHSGQRVTDADRATAIAKANERPMVATLMAGAQ